MNKPPTPSDRSTWTSAHYLAYIEGWSYARIGTPKHPSPVPHEMPNVMASAHQVASRMGAPRQAVTDLGEALGVEAARPYYELGMREAA